MTTTMKLRGFGLALAMTAVACANGNDQQDNGGVDAGADTTFDASPDTATDTHPEVATDSGPRDTGTDAPASDGDASSPDTSTKCAYPDTETRPCGHCGKQTRFCLPSDVWTGWSGCAGEIVGDVECSVGETRSSTCGNCGTSTDVCDPVSCTFVSGSCAGEGPCTPGDVETTTASCAAGLTRTHTCTDACAWTPFSDCSLPTGWLTMAATPSTFAARHDHVAVWTGTEMLVWGGESSFSVKGDGAAYRPSSDTWRMLPAAAGISSGRTQASAVWTGSTMIVWGGQDNGFGFSSYHNDGAIYDPSTNTWTAIPSAPIDGRQRAAAVWSTTTNELVVWGGYAGYSTPNFGDGAAYNPATRSWRTIAPSPLGGRYWPAYAWSGTEMVIYGGTDDSSAFNDGARYDPVTDSWITFADSPGTPRYDSLFAFGDGTLFVAGGYFGSFSGGSDVAADAARYVSGAGWSTMPSASSSDFAGGTQRYGGLAWFANHKFYVFGGAGTSSSAVGGAGFYDPTTDRWTGIDPTGAPAARYHGSVVWTGDVAIVWGGITGTYGSDIGGGAMYRPAP